LPTLRSPLQEMRQHILAALVAVVVHVFLPVGC
jgi:hypothetical protein